MNFRAQIVIFVKVQYQQKSKNVHFSRFSIYQNHNNSFIFNTKIKFTISLIFLKIEYLVHFLIVFRMIWKTFCLLFFWVDCTSLPILYWPLPNWCSGLLWRLDLFTLSSTFLLFPNLHGLWPFLSIKAAICTWFIALSAKILVTCKHEIKFPTFNFESVFVFYDTLFLAENPTFWSYSM